jgi:TPR repeat protein
VFADFAKSLEVAQKGDYAAALKNGSQGDSCAQYNLGLMYTNGQRVIQDYETAAKW